MTSPSVYIRVGKAGFTIPVTFQPLTVGRAADNLVHIDDKSVDEHHCIVLRRGDVVHVMDLGSKGGTKLNGKAIQSGPIGVGDVVKIGTAELRLAGGAAGPVAPALADVEFEEDLLPTPTVAITAEDLVVPIPRDPGDSSGPIRVVTDPETDIPPYVPPPRNIDDLLMPRDMDQALKAFLSRDAGLVVICGPEGSGRTTTAYTMLRHLAMRKRIVTFEQPPELQIEGAAQVFVHDTKEYSAQVLRMMGTSPQVLFLGEPPPQAALLTALAAAVGQCLVIAVADSQDAVAQVYDWLMKSSKPKALASSLKLVISQRLVPRLCDKCKAPVPLDEPAERKLAPFLEHIDKMYMPDACPDCNNTGFVGRIGVFEVLTVGDGLRSLLMTRHPSMADIRAACDPKHLIPLRLSAYARVAQGLTTLEEADKAIAAPSRK